MIPKTLRIVHKVDVTITEPISKREYQVWPAFYIPDGDEKRLKTARDWAVKTDQSWTGGAFGERVVPNDAIKKLTLVGVEHRSEGGLAYKVITPDGFLVDLREPEFWHSFFKGNVDSKSAEIRGEFIWVLNVTQMRLTYVGSPIYEKALQAQGKVSRETRPLKTSDLEVGKFYLPDPNYPSLGFYFLGRVRHDGKKKFAWRSSHFHEAMPVIDVTDSAKSLVCEAAGPDHPFGFRQGEFRNYLNHRLDGVDWADEVPQHLVGRGLYVRQDGLEDQIRILADFAPSGWRDREWIRNVPGSHTPSLSSLGEILSYAVKYGLSLAFEELSRRAGLDIPSAGG